MRQVIYSAVLIVCLAATAFGQSITFTNPKPTDVPFGAPVRLLPDGKQMYWVDRADAEGDQREYAYFIANIDGTGKRKLFDSAIGMDDIFAFSMVNGCVSPSSKKLAVMTTHNGKPWTGRDDNEEAKPIVVIVDQQGKELKRLPTEFGVITSPLFIDENTVVFCDNTNPDRGGRENMQTKLQQIDLTTGKIKTLKHFETTFATCLQLSPDRKRIAGVSVDFHEREAMQLFVFDLADGRYTAAESGELDDTYFDGGPWFIWSGDSKHVITARRNREPAPQPGAVMLSRHQIIRFSPDADEADRLTVLSLKPNAVPEKPKEVGEKLTEQQRKQVAKLIDQLGHPDFAKREAAQKELIAFGKPALPMVEAAKESDDAEVALRAETVAARIKGEPGPNAVHRHQSVRYHLAATLSDQHLSVTTSDDNQPAYALNIASGKVTTYQPKRLVVDRVGNTVLIADRKNRKVYSATVQITP
jgi:hypothetical protein